MSHHDSQLNETLLKETHKIFAAENPPKTILHPGANTDKVPVMKIDLCGKKKKTTKTFHRSAPQGRTRTHAGEGDILVCGGQISLPWEDLIDDVAISQDSQEARTHLDSRRCQGCWQGRSKKEKRPKTCACLCKNKSNENEHFQRTKRKHIIFAGKYSNHICQAV